MIAVEALHDPANGAPKFSRGRMALAIAFSVAAHVAALAFFADRLNHSGMATADKTVHVDILVETPLSAVAPDVESAPVATDAETALAAHDAVVAPASDTTEIAEAVGEYEVARQSDADNAAAPAVMNETVKAVEPERPDATLSPSTPLQSAGIANTATPFELTPTSDAERLDAAPSQSEPGATSQSAVAVERHDAAIPLEPVGNRLETIVALDVTEADTFVPPPPLLTLPGDPPTIDEVVELPQTASVPAIRPALTEPAKMARAKPRPEPVPPVRKATRSEPAKAVPAKAADEKKTAAKTTSARPQRVAKSDKRASDKGEPDKGKRADRTKPAAKAKPDRAIRTAAVSCLGGAGASTAKSARGASASGSPAQYGKKLLSHVERHKRYPAAAERQRITGATRLSISIDRAGNLAGARIASASGQPILDEEALAVARRAAPYPKPPEGVGGRTFTFAVTLRFRK